MEATIAKSECVKFGVSLCWSPARTQILVRGVTFSDFAARSNNTSDTRSRRYPRAVKTKYLAGDLEPKWASLLMPEVHFRTAYQVLPGFVSSSLKALLTIALIVLGAMMFVNRPHITAWAKSMITTMLHPNDINRSDKGMIHDTLAIIKNQAQMSAEKEIERATKARNVMKEEMRRPAPQAPKGRDDKFQTEVEAGERPISREQVLLSNSIRAVLRLILSWQTDTQSGLGGIDELFITSTEGT
ncbi:uncharacterized protein FOMMEDRAFT_159789 [Fomitiporia mediterranea MF3/22]|uniref:uncharacterized protein n=1 Tax=Fomitiporia mediterranea (strain MF3/22) TaxID=694068 RepID=UPI0004408B7C|nr:uncharacterized protein FOMMEDRAFT_159789 [Fomitiporia mediterranea MF3/22]EJD00144.1 hypothetical protein FOMMEDRAFT_159789 [Fomitiporia mediterranea MF3/22]